MLTASQLKYGVLGKLSAARQKIQYRNFHPTCGEDAVVRGIDDQIAYLARLLDHGNMEMFLRRLTEITGKLSELFWGRGLFVPDVDELARRAGFTIAPKPNAAANSGILVHVATEVYPTGGHTRVIEDIVECLPEYRHELIITNMTADHPNLARLSARFGELNLNVRLLQGSRLTAKVRELSSLLASLRPGTITLFGHPNDAVLNVAVTHQSATRILFFHHVDHYPCLGASRCDFTHVDLTPRCHKACLSYFPVRASMLSLTVKDRGTLRLPHRDPMIAATCGSPNKYAGSIEFSYGDLLAKLFSAGVDKVLHIGALPSEQQDSICTDISANGQDSRRVVFLPNVPSLAAKLIEISPDFYLHSHPIMGGKASIEAMSVGLPTFHVQPVATPPLLAADMTFGTAVRITRLEQIPFAFRRLANEATELAKNSRATYEEHYSPAAFRRTLLSLLEINR